MYASSPYWTFQVRRPPARWRERLRAGLMAGGIVVALVFALSKTVVGEGPVGNMSYTVRAGDTVWSIAAQRFPGSDVRERVGEIERLNGLGAPTIIPGEVLKLPTS